MTKYKINLDKVWNLPIGTGAYRTCNDKFCALGLVCAGAIGEENVEKDGFKTEKQLQFQKDLENYKVISKSEILSGCAFDGEINSNPTEMHEAIRSKWVKKILQAGIEMGLFELKDSDLQIVKELRQIKSRIEIKNNILDPIG